MTAGAGQPPDIHLAGAFGIEQIEAYNRTRREDRWNFPRFFPMWKLVPGWRVRALDPATVTPRSLLLVVNLDAATWTRLEPLLEGFGRRILVQLEARNGFETAYDVSFRFDDFLSFDPSQAAHVGFRRIFLPYDARWGSSHFDERGLRAALRELRGSPRRFGDVYLGRVLPRKRKAVLIGSLHPQPWYQDRLAAVRRWRPHVDVFGRGWPPDVGNVTCVSKLDVLRRYRYALVMESQRQPGYVTEKLLDCFAAGTVPVYWGAPDVEQTIPAPCLVDLDGVSDPAALVGSESEYHSRREALAASRTAVLERYGMEQFWGALEAALRADRPASARRS